MRRPVYNAKEFKEALIKAEGQLTTVGRPSGPGAIVKLLPSEIETRPELFQPREFSFGLRSTDGDHVKRLKRSIGILGELDPVVVIKLGKKFVCVDGHHRLEAYKAEHWAKPIKCEWFGGTVREAVDESIRQNAKDRLNVAQADRLEAAWKRVLLGWGSKAEIVRLCGVSQGTVAQMRRVAARGREESDLGVKFREALGFKLIETSWSQAKLAFLGFEKNEIDDEVRAERLARRIRSRLTDLLSRDPKVTARALELYDPELPMAIADAWDKLNPLNAMADGEVGDVATNAKALSRPDNDLRREMREYRERISAIEAELTRRANGGTPSDITWDGWVRDEDQPT